MCVHFMVFAPRDNIAIIACAMLCVKFMRLSLGRSQHTTIYSSRSFLSRLFHVIVVVGVFGLPKDSFG